MKRGRTELSPSQTKSQSPTLTLLPGVQSPGTGSPHVPTPACGCAGSRCLTFQQLPMGQCFLPACRQLLPPPLSQRRRVHLIPRYLCLSTSVIKKAILSLACLSMKIYLLFIFYWGLQHRQYSSCINHCTWIKHKVCTPANSHAS